MKKHYETHVEDTDKLISVAGPILEYKSWYEQYRKLMEEQAQRKYGLYTPTSEGDDDDFPSIPGMIARYSASGLTNEQMKENPVWVDKTGNGHDLQMKNFAWSEMSGVGGYKLNWGDSNIWSNYITRGTFGTGEVTDNTIHITSAKTNNSLFETRASLKSVEYKVLIKGLTDDIYLRYGVFNDGKELWTEIKNDGIYTLPSYDYDSRYNMKWKVMSQTYPIDCNITIEQLPLYPGFILGDGVDDFAVTEKELNFEDTYTVYTAFIPFQNNPTRNMILCGADSKKTFSMQYSSLVYVSFIAGNNYYINANFVNGLNLFACKRNGNNICIKNLLTNKVVTGTCGDWVENAGLYYLWKNATYVSFARAAIAGQTICNGYFSTDEDDEKVLDWYKKQYPWLFPDQAWTVTGKTNEDEDRATIANITGNGNDLVLSNFGFIEGSGYNKEGEYAGYLVTDGVDDKVQSFSFTMNEDWTIVGDWELLSNVQINCGIVKAQNVYLYNTVNGLLISINNPRSLRSFGTKSLHAICSDGRLYDRNWVEYEYTVDQNFAIVKSSLNIGFNLNNYTQIAFKNLGTYNNQILSKEDCIKAYNYLQTLKAK
jgi:hypothetical protein